MSVNKNCAYCHFKSVLVSWFIKLCSLAIFKVAYANTVKKNGFFIGLLDLALLARSRKKRLMVLHYHDACQDPPQLAPVMDIFHPLYASSEHSPPEDIMHVDHESGTWNVAVLLADYTRGSYQQLNHFVPLFQKDTMGEQLWSKLTQESSIKTCQTDSEVPSNASGGRWIRWWICSICPGASRIAPETARLQPNHSGHRSVCIRGSWWWKLWSVDNVIIRRRPHCQMPGCRPEGCSTNAWRHLVFPHYLFDMFHMYSYVSICVSYKKTLHTFLPLHNDFWKNIPRNWLSCGSECLMTRGGSCCLQQPGCKMRFRPLRFCRREMMCHSPPCETKGTSSYGQAFTSKRTGGTEKSAVVSASSIWECQARRTFSQGT